MTTVYRLRINVEGGAFYYVGDAYVLKDDAHKAASRISDSTAYELRKILGIVGITVEPMVIR